MSVDPVFRLDAQKRAIIRAKGEAGIVQVIRRSTMKQKQNGQGGDLHQRNQVRYLERLGIEDCPVVTMDFVESAKEGRDHQFIEDLIEAVRKGVRVLLFAYGSRIARDEIDGARLLQFCAEHKAILIVKGELFDPRDPHQYAALMGMIMAARLENAERSFGVSAAQYELARTHCRMIKLPAGLVWADPESMAYRSMAAVAELDAWISAEQLERHLVFCHRGSRKYFVLPDPRKNVFSAYQLIAQWILQTRSLPEVIHRIRTDPSYPCPGKIPEHAGHLFDAVKEPEWTSVKIRRLNRWLRATGVYGIYQHTSRSLEKYTDLADPQYRLENAFPSLFRPEHQADVKEVLAAGQRKYRSNRYAGPRNHRLSRLYCAHENDDGSLCNGRLYASYNRSGEYHYAGKRCQALGHTSYQPMAIDDAVIDILCRTFQGAAIEQMMEQVRLTVEHNQERREFLQREVEKWGGKIEFAAEREEQGKENGDQEEEAYWQAKRKERMAELKRIQRELTRCKGDAARLRELTRRDLEKVRALVVDVRSLIEEGRALEREGEAEWRLSRQPVEGSGGEGLVRRLVGALTTAVRVRSTGHGVHVLEVIFPTGARVQHLVFCNALEATQAEVAWIGYRTDQGVPLDDVAGEINQLRDAGARNFARRHPWTADMVQTAVLMLKAGKFPRPPEGKYVAVGDLAPAVGEEESVVVSAALAGRLGPARVESGSLAIIPTEVLLHQTFPDYARSWVAREAGWPFDDTVRAGELVREGVPKGSLEGRAARSGSGLRYDLAGRRYVRRSEVTDRPHSLERVLLTAPEHLKNLPREHWIPLPDAVRKTGASGIIIRTMTHVVGSQRMYCYIDPETEERLEGLTLSAAAQKYGLKAEDFLSVTELAPLMQRAGYRSHLPVEYAAQIGRVLVIRARTAEAGDRRVRRYFYTPPEVREGDEDAVRRWIKGQEPQWRPWTS